MRRAGSASRTAGQADNFGPDAQLEQQTRAIERWGLVDTGGAWQVAHSGRTIAATGQWAEMLAGAGRGLGGPGRRLRVPLRPGPADRGQRPPRPPRPGRVILFADERVLSSDEDEWERWAREAVEAEAYSRRLAKRIREGYAAKRRRLGVPGGNRAPLGTVREAGPSPSTRTRWRSSAASTSSRQAGRTDREVGKATGLAPTHVAEVLTNPFYAGRLRTGEPSALGALVDARDLGARPGDARRDTAADTAEGRTDGQYGLAGLLACAACGRRLTGHVGRYRHLDACEAFKAAAAAPPPAQCEDDLDHRVKGESYKVEVYEDAIGLAFKHVAVSSTLKASTVALARRPEPDNGDVLAQARITRERDQAALRFAKDRDLGRLEATMARLDAEAQAAVVRPSRVPTAAEARDTWSRCRTCGPRPRMLGGTRSRRPCSSGSTSWGWPTTRSR